MAAVFQEILAMSLNSSVVIILVLLSRLFLKKASKVFSYCLWLVVLFRLLCPVLPSLPVWSPVLTVPPMPETFLAATHSGWLYASAVWLIGVCCFSAYSIVKYLRLYKDLAEAVWDSGNIWLSDRIESAFVLGVYHSKIYLPASATQEDRCYMLLHERAHIRWKDHLVKMAAYIALNVHWFNPLVWIAFLLLGQDMEMWCDERVIRKLGPENRAEYAAALVRLAACHSGFSSSPPAFGGGDTKGRVKNMAAWKKQSKCGSILCGLLCAAVMTACAATPGQQAPQVKRIVSEIETPNVHTPNVPQAPNMDHPNQSQENTWIELAYLWEAESKLRGTRDYVERERLRLDSVLNLISEGEK